MSLRVLSRREAAILIARGWKIAFVNTVPFGARGLVEWCLFFGERPTA